MNKQKVFKTLEFLFLSTLNNIDQLLYNLNGLRLNLNGKDLFLYPSQQTQVYLMWDEREFRVYGGNLVELRKNSRNRDWVSRIATRILASPPDSINP